jgi:periplasmic protein TonB
VQAVAASVVLHALVLWLLPLLKEAQKRIPAPPLTAHLQAPKPPPPPPPAPPKSEPLPAPVRPTPVARAAPQVPAPTPPILSVEPTKQAAEPAFVVPAQPAAAPAAPALGANAGPSGPPTAAPAASGLDPGAIGRFRLELMDVARRYKRYPRIAQDNNWEGRVELRVAIGETGAITSLTVKKSAGRTVLDDEAQAMIRTAKSKVAIPPALLGTAFNLDIAVDFFLKEE